MGTRAVVVVEDVVAADGRRSHGAGALEHVANQSIAEHVIGELRSAGLTEVVVASSRERAEDVRAALAAGSVSRSLSLSFVEQDGPLDVTDALKLAAPLVGDAPCIVHLASGLLGEPLTPLIDRLQGGAPDIVLIVHQQPGPDEHLSAATQDILHLAELHPERATLGLAGVWLFGPRALHHLGGVPWHMRGDVDLTDVAERISAVGGSFHVCLSDGWRNYSGNPLELLELNQIALDRLEGDERRVNGNGKLIHGGNRIEGRVRIHESACVCSSVIVGPTVIGAGAHVSDAYIGPYTSIGDGARIEGAEIERSIIAAGASVTHIGGRLAASVVGRHARIFRDFSLPRALRLQVGDGTQVALC